MRVDDRRFALALAGVFVAMAGVLALLGVFVSPVALGVALPLGVAAYLLWRVADGRVRVRTTPGGAAFQTRGERARAAGGAWRERARGPGRSAGRTGGRRRRDRSNPAASPERGLSRTEAYRHLGLEPGASEAAVKRAYRQKVKDVHPDRGGDEGEFKRVTRAYDRLT